MREFVQTIDTDEEVSVKNEEIELEVEDDILDNENKKKKKVNKNKQDVEEKVTNKISSKDQNFDVQKWEILGLFKNTIKAL